MNKQKSDNSVAQPTGVVEVDLIAFKWAESLSMDEQSVLLMSSLKRLQVMIDAALLSASTAPRSRARKQKIEDQLRDSDLTAQLSGGRTDVEYGHHESLPRGEHVTRIKK